MRRREHSELTARTGTDELSTSGILFLALLVGVLEQVGRLLPSQWPRRDLDVSWMMGLELARHDHLKYGSDIVFTYGPWGFLSAPTPLDASDLVLAGCFRVVVVGALFVALNSALRRVRHGVLAAATLALLMANGSQSGWLLLLVLTVWGLTSLTRGDTPNQAALATAAAVAALLVQVKLTEGVLAVVLLAVLTVGRRRWFASVMTCGSFVAWFALWWVLAGQSIKDIPRWVALGWEVVAGYGDAQAYVDVNGLAVAMALGTGTAAALAVTVKGLDRVTRLGVLVVLLFFSKVALSMPDSAHLMPGFAATVAVLAVLLGATTSRPARMTLVVAMTALALLLTAGSPIVGRRHVSLDDRALDVLSSRHSDNLARSRADLVSELEISPEVVAALRDHPVSIDPWEISVVWAYGLDWQPMPIFQQYQAYTKTLDEVNARALLSDPSQRVLREPARKHPRHPLWDTPAYTLALLCNFEPVAADAVWTALARAENRCGAERSVSAGHVEAGEVVELPVPVDSTIALRFVPEPRRVGDRLLGLVGVQRHLLHAEVDGRDYRLPEGLAGGPLIVGTPHAEPVLFDLPAASRISFDRGGTLEIVEIPLSGRESE